MSTYDYPKLQRVKLIIHQTKTVILEEIWVWSSSIIVIYLLPYFQGFVTLVYQDKVVILVFILPPSIRVDFPEPCWLRDQAKFFWFKVNYSFLYLIFQFLLLSWVFIIFFIIIFNVIILFMITAYVTNTPQLGSVIRKWLLFMLFIFLLEFL